MLSGSPAYLGPAEWDYRRLPLVGDLPEGSVSELDYDAGTVRSVSSTGTSVSRRVSAGEVDKEVHSEERLEARPASSATSAISTASANSTSSSASKAPSRGSVHTSSSVTPTRSRIAEGRSEALKLPDNPNRTTRPAPSKVPSAVGSQTSPKALGRSQYHLPRLHSGPDPHHHPSTAPPPASALSVYMLSHRYRLEILESLAKEHILSRMTSESCMPML